MDNKGHNLL